MGREGRVAKQHHQDKRSWQVPNTRGSARGGVVPTMGGPSGKSEPTTRLMASRAARSAASGSEAISNAVAQMRPSSSAAAGLSRAARRRASEQDSHAQRSERGTRHRTFIHVATIGRLLAQGSRRVGDGRAQEGCTQGSRAKHGRCEGTSLRFAGGRRNSQRGRLREGHDFRGERARRHEALRTYEKKRCSKTLMSGEHDAGTHQRTPELAQQTCASSRGSSQRAAGASAMATGRNASRRCGGAHHEPSLTGWRPPGSVKGRAASVGGAVWTTMEDGGYPKRVAPSAKGADGIAKRAGRRRPVAHGKGSEMRRRRRTMSPGTLTRREVSLWEVGAEAQGSMWDGKLCPRSGDPQRNFVCPTVRSPSPHAHGEGTANHSVGRSRRGRVPSAARVHNPPRGGRPRWSDFWQLPREGCWRAPRAWLARAA